MILKKIFFTQKDFEEGTLYGFTQATSKWIFRSLRRELSSIRPVEAATQNSPPDAHSNPDGRM